MKHINVVMADDHVLVLEGFRMLISKYRGITLLFTANNGEELLKRMAQADTLPDLVMLDLAMPGPPGMETLVELRSRFPSVKILIVSTFTSSSHILSSMRKGANGYLSKDLDSVTLEQAIRQTVKTGFYLPESLKSQFPPKMLKQLKESDAGTSNTQHIQELLTPFEISIVVMIANGKTSREISKEVQRTTRTVEGIRQRILRKTGTSNTAELIRKAVETGWIEE